MNDSKNFIPLSVPHVGGNEWSYVKECLDTGWLSSVGSFVDDFEKKLAHFVGAPYAVATSNGTAALHLALLASGVQVDDEVLVPTITFAATINAVHYCRARPVFFDCDTALNIDIDAVERFLTEECTRRDEGVFNRTTGKRVWGVLPVHIFGVCVDMERLQALSSRFSLSVVEDAAEALGSFHRTRHAGTFGSVGCFSFNGNKIISTGGGGMVVTHSEQLATKIRYLSTQAKDDALQFIHHEVGFNYRLTNLQAAVGVAQLEQLPGFIAKKKSIFTRYRTELNGYRSVSLIEGSSDGSYNYWLTNIVLDPGEGLSALDMVRRLEQHNIQARPVWYPNHLQKPNQGCTAYRISRATELATCVVSLPSSVGLSEDDQSRVIAAVKACYPDGRG
jgi:perosamine synthetase